uniref:Gypsy retrotransposon integrase-like protein 1 n=1 Tax=Poeciliopsis prolifica TaxID=188132 RepID=A0A0S7ESR5_9TELE
MTKAECRYAQIEKECLGLAYGLERFHNYVYGLPSFVVETDHRPLVAIIKKHLNEMSPRIQRLMMKMQRYEFTLIYTPGKHLILADALSRDPTHDSVSSTEEDIQCHVNLVSNVLPVSDRKLQQIVDATAKDTELQLVIQNMDEGWPIGSCSQFFNVKADLSVVNGLLLKNNRIVIPQELRQEILQRIHEGHLGIEKCKRRARESVFWPGLNKDIEVLISKCETCQTFRNKQSKEPMIISDTPTSPWLKVGMDLFHLKGKDYLVIIDYYSNYPEMALLANMSSNCIITHAKSIFARHGIPHVVVSDNGPCFNSREWQRFAEQYDFKHITSSPHYAQSNGKAEKGVHILKQLLKKAADSNSDPYLALLSYRSSPLQCGYSPAELLMNRKIRTTLPSYDNKGQRAKKSSKLEYKLRKQKVKQKSYYDRSAKLLPPLSYQDPVRIQDDEGWKTKATILQEVAPRSFEVKTEDGQILRRNRRSLLKTPFEHVDESSEDSKDSQITPTTETHCDMDSIKDNPPPVLRRSTRVVKKPDRLML